MAMVNTNINLPRQLYAQFDLSMKDIIARHNDITYAYRNFVKVNDVDKYHMIPFMNKKMNDYSDAVRRLNLIAHYIKSNGLDNYHFYDSDRKFFRIHNTICGINANINRYRDEYTESKLSPYIDRLNDQTQKLHNTLMRFEERPNMVSLDEIRKCEINIEFAVKQYYKKLESLNKEDMVPKQSYDKCLNFISDKMDQVGNDLDLRISKAEQETRKAFENLNVVYNKLESSIISEEKLEKFAKCHHDFENICNTYSYLINKSDNMLNEYAGKANQEIIQYTKIANDCRDRVVRHVGIDNYKYADKAVNAANKSRNNRRQSTRNKPATITR